MFRLGVSILLVTLLSIGSVRADEVKRIEDDKAKEIAKLLLDASAKLDLPAKASPTDKGALGIEAGKAVAFLMPDVKLDPANLAKLDKGIVPLAVLYTTESITLSSNEQGIAATEHRTIEVTAKGKTVKVNVVTLAAGKIEGKLVLLAYTKDKKPTVVVEITEGDGKSVTPIEVDAKEVGKKRAAILLTIGGKYRAALPVTAQAQD